MDAMIEEGCKLDFARASVEIYLDKIFLHVINFRLSNGKTTELKVEYSCRLLKCSTCKCFKHVNGECRVGKQAFMGKEENNGSTKLKECQ